MPELAKIPCAVSVDYVSRRVILTDGEVNIYLAEADAAALGLMLRDSAMCLREIRLACSKVDTEPKARRRAAESETGGLQIVEGGLYDE